VIEAGRAAAQRVRDLLLALLSDPRLL